MQSILRHNGTLMINKGLNDSKIKTTTQGAAVKQTTNNKQQMDNVYQTNNSNNHIKR